MTSDTYTSNCNFFAISCMHIPRCDKWEANDIVKVDARCANIIESLAMSRRNAGLISRAASLRFNNCLIAARGPVTEQCIRYTRARKHNCTMYIGQLDAILPTMLRLSSGSLRDASRRWDLRRFAYCMKREYIVTKRLLIFRLLYWIMISIHVVVV